MDNAPYVVKIDATPEKATMLFSGQLIINHISKITEIVKDGLNINANLAIVIDHPENLDVTFIQLLYSLKNTFSAENKNVIFSAHLSEELKALVTNSGFNLIQN